MVKNRRRSTALKMACAGMLTALCLENVALGAFSVPVHAEDATADAVQMAGQIFWDSPAIKSLRRTLVTEYTSLDYNEIALIEWELGAGYQLMDYTLKHDYLTEQGLEMNDSLGGSYNVTGIIYYTNSDGINTEGIASGIVSKSGFSFMSDAGNIAVYPIGNENYSNVNVSSSYPYCVELNFVQLPGNLDFQGYLSTSGLFDVRNGFGYGRRSNFSFQYQLYWIGGLNYQYWGNISSSNPNLSWKTGTDGYGAYDCFNNVSVMGIRGCNNGAVIYQQDDDPEEFLNKAKQDAVSRFGQELVNELWVDLDFNDLPDTGNLDSLTFPPGLPSVDFNDIELPTEPLPAQMINGATFWFSSFSQMLDALGVKYIVITFLVIALVIAILKI